MGHFLHGPPALLAAPITGHLLGSLLGRPVPFSPDRSGWCQRGGAVALNVSEEGQSLQGARWALAGVTVWQWEGCGGACVCMRVFNHSVLSDSLPPHGL